MCLAKLKVKGRVQGVFYRVSTQEMGRKFGLVGYVKNDPDGGVTVVARGPKEKVAKLIDWCSQGPAGANVSDVSVNWLESEESNSEFKFSDFEIRRT